MNDVHGLRVAEIVRIVVAVIAGAASSFGYFEFVGQDRMRPDPWYGSDGRAQNSRIDSLELYVAKNGVRMDVIEGAEVPRAWFKEQVDRHFENIEARIMSLEVKIDRLLPVIRNGKDSKP